MRNYEVIRSNRKSIAIEIRPDLQVIVRAPNRMPNSQIEVFVRAKSAWIEKSLERMRLRMIEMEQQPKLSREDISTLAEQAKLVIPQRVAYYAKAMDVDYGRITIRNQKTRWGSCSSKGNLNFNCLLMKMPTEVLDYVVVHELCHRKEMNHSERFWTEVEKVLPDYRSTRRWLKENGSRWLLQM